MDWIRRNWPDLLIGIALLAVIGGIIATLLNGGSFFNFTQSPPAVTTPTTPSTPQQPQTATPTETTPPDTEGQATEVMPQAPGATTPTDTGTTIPVIPSLDDEDEEADQPSTTPAAEPDAITPVQPTGATGATGTPQTTPQPSPTPQATAAPTDPFRISVGSFGVPENAERRAAEFRNAGFPVFIAPQGDLSLVLVGPYTTRTEAEQARNSIVSAGLESDPWIIEFTDDTTVQQTTAQTSTPAPTTTEATEATPNPAATTPAPTTGGSLIQVGAYGSSQSAQPQRQRLEALGFSVSELQEGSLVRLVIGPFAAADLAEVRARLTAQGIDHFVR